MREAKREKKRDRKSPTATLWNVLLSGSVSPLFLSRTNDLSASWTASSWCSGLWTISVWFNSLNSFISGGSNSPSLVTHFQTKRKVFSLLFYSGKRKHSNISNCVHLYIKRHHAVSDISFSKSIAHTWVFYVETFRRKEWVRANQGHRKHGELCSKKIPHLLPNVKREAAHLILVRKSGFAISRTRPSSSKPSRTAVSILLKKDVFSGKLSSKFVPENTFCWDQCIDQD